MLQGFPAQLQSPFTDVIIVARVLARSLILSSEIFFGDPDSISLPYLLGA